MNVIEIVTQIVGPFLAGGGAVWLLNFRLRARRESNELHKDEFNTVSEIVERATRQISELADKVAQIETEKAELKRQIAYLIDENKRLDKENKNLAGRVKRYMEGT